MADKKLILLTGVGRSGTTVLQSMLNAHSQISFPPETHFFKRYILPFQLRNKLPDPDKLRADNYLKRLDNNLREQILKSTFSGVEELRAAFMKILENPSASFLGDKDTEYVRYLPHLKQLFPDAYSVHIIRDPRDVVVSRTKTEWGSKRSIAFHAGEYQYYIKQVTKLGPQLFGEKYLELRYEDLLDQPEDELKKLLEKLSLSFEPAMLEFHKSSKTLVAKDEAAWKQNLDKPLLKANHGKWKTTLTGKQAGLIESGIEEFMRSHGYKLSGERPSILDVMKKGIVKVLFAGKTQKESLR